MPIGSIFWPNVVPVPDATASLYNQSVYVGQRKITHMRTNHLKK